jgi:hypothetical protein
VLKPPAVKAKGNPKHFRQESVASLNGAGSPAADSGGLLFKSWVNLSFKYDYS